MWRNTAVASEHDVTDDVTAASESADDMDKISFGFMTWQSNATLLHYRTEDTRHTLDITLVGLTSCLSSLLVRPTFYQI